jgi:excisionase family DNA binding protein
VSLKIDSSNAAPALEQLVRKVDSLASLLSELSSKFPTLDSKLTDLQELLSSRRKKNFTVGEVAELTGRSAYTIRRWVAHGKLKAIRLRDGGPRGKLIIARTEFERLIAAGKDADVPGAVLC